MTKAFSIDEVGDGEFGVRLRLYFLSDILQGDPLSGSVFALCVDPLMRELHMSFELAGNGMARACADDVGRVFGQWKASLALERISGKIERAAALKLGIKKCVGISLVPPCVTVNKIVSN